MSEFLIRLMNLSSGLRRCAAFALLLISIVTMAVAVFIPLSVLSRKAHDIREHREELYRLEQIISRRPSNLEDLPGTNAVFLEGDALSAVQANLHARISAFASAAGATVASISGAPVLRSQNMTQAGVRADIEGELKSVHELIRVIEVSQPPLVIHNASVRSASASSRARPTETSGIAAQITVYGAINPSVSVGERKP